MAQAGLAERRRNHLIRNIRCRGTIARGNNTWAYGSTKGLPAIHGRTYVAARNYPMDKGQSNKDYGPNEYAHRRLSANRSAKKEGTMIRTMFDSTAYLDIPASVDNEFTLIATYANGSGFVPIQDVKNRFPLSQLVRINVDADPTRGDCLDVETGDATPDHLDAWARARLNGGVPLSSLAVYCNRITLPAVLAATSVHLFHWVATLDGTLWIPTFKAFEQPAAVQFANATMAGANVDVSLVYEDGWHPVPLT